MRTKNRGLTYLRRSTSKQEIGLPRQLEWSISAAQQHEVLLDVTPTDLTHMVERRLHSYKAIRLDDGISGSDLTRPGFLAFNADALKDEAISHVFFYKRDRFARPDDAMQAAQIEKALRSAGITVVHSDGVSLPLRRGEQNFLHDLEPLLAYYQGGEELRKHAERVFGFQQNLAQGGYRVGGNAPFGFVRVLVDATGQILEELPRGKTVKLALCHVRVVPKDLAKVAVWLQILEWKEQGWGSKRIAKTLSERGIPSPDAGRTRTDHGVRHLVSGKWNHNTVLELCRNPIFIGVQEYGKRSEGKIRRLGAEGPRLLDEKADLTAVGRPKIVLNNPELRIARKVGEIQFDVKRWNAVQAQMKQRGQNQRGVPRAKNPARYPLACRLVDLTEGCGSVLYARTTHQRPVYTCGRYMSTAECASNQVDGEAILRFTLKTLRQFVELQGRREKLSQKLLERARRDARKPEIDSGALELSQLRGRQSELQADLAKIEYRMARESNDKLYKALARQYQAAQSASAALSDEIRRLDNEQPELTVRQPDEQAEAALALLDDVQRITSDPSARAEINPLLKRLGLRIGLTFQPVVKGKKRKVQRLTSGRMVFGDAALAVPLFGKSSVEPDVHQSGPVQRIVRAETARDLRGKAQSTTPCGSGSGSHLVDDVTDNAGEETVSSSKPSEGNQGVSGPANQGCQSEGTSITKVSRGDRI